MSAVEAFKSAVLRIRDILRGPGIAITGMDSMRHICIYLVSRYITIARAPQLDVPLELAWENIIGLLRKDGGVQKALDIFNHPNAPTRIIDHFDRLFGTQGFSFDVKAILRHKEILEILDKVNMEDVDCHMDMLGWVYEQHLSTGSSKAGRDLGQFFTNRALCKYMTALCRPGFKAPGVPESVCDPTMGTGGFLTSYIKYYHETYPEQPINWAIHACEIHGCDADMRVAGVARMNIFMETKGARAIDVIHHDSLYDGLSQSGYDIILANMPFGLKGIKFADCCERIKKLKFNGTKSEPLFLQLIMQSLNMNGRCAVVVPDGVLIDNHEMQIQTRKHLMTQFDLRKVIRTKGKMFMNTSINPWILYFANSEHEVTGDIEFSEIEKNSSGEIVETPITTISVDDLDQDTYSLDIRKYLEIETINFTSQYEYNVLSSVCTITKGKRCLESVNTGGFPYQDVASITRMVPTYILDTPSVLTPRIMSLGRMVYISEKCHPSDDMFIITPKNQTQLITKYVYFYASLGYANIIKKFSHGIKPTINYDVFDKLMISIPPRDIQEQIVATIETQLQRNPGCIDNLVRLSPNVMNLLLRDPNGSTLIPIVDALYLSTSTTRMIRAIKDQMRAIMNSQRYHGWDQQSLKNVCTVAFGGRVTKKKDAGTQYPVFGSGENTFMIDKFNRTGPTCKIGRFAVSSTNMVMLLDETYWLLDSGFTVTSKDESIMLTRYLWYCLWADADRISKLSGGSCQQNIEMDQFYKINYPCPPIEFQNDIIARMDELIAQYKKLDHLKNHSESNARLILNSYLSSSVESMTQVSESVPIEQRMEAADGASSSGTTHDDTDDESE